MTSRGVVSCALRWGGGICSRHCRELCCFPSIVPNARSFDQRYTPSSILRTTQDEGRCPFRTTSSRHTRQPQPRNRKRFLQPKDSSRLLHREAVAAFFRGQTHYQDRAHRRELRGSLDSSEEALLRLPARPALWQDPDELPLKVAT